jgi:putative transcriptional regulator
MANRDPSQSSLTGQLLVAMPQMMDPRFARTVVYLCAHSSDGAMGLVVNRLIDSLTFRSLLSQLGVEAEGEPTDMPVHFGDLQDSSLVIDDEIALTATIDVLKAIARGAGPRRRVLALGYAGWAPGQLDAEIQANGWLLVPADLDLVFGIENASKWQRALAKIGIDLSLLSSEAGHA